MTTATLPTGVGTLTLTLAELETPKGKLKAQKAINNGKRVMIRVDGLAAFTAGGALGRSAAAPTGTTGTSTAFVVGEVVLTAAIVIGVIAVIGLAVVAVVCLDGMSKGYTVRARHIARGPNPFDDTLEFTLIPPVRN